MSEPLTFPRGSEIERCTKPGCWIAVTTDGITFFREHFPTRLAAESRTEEWKAYLATERRLPDWPQIPKCKEVPVS